MIYEFRCNDCKKTFERILRISDRDTDQKCECGSNNTERVISAPVYMDENTDFGSPNKNATRKALERIHKETAGSNLNKSMDI